MCPHTSVCVRILLYMCPHTAIYLSAYCYICVRILLYVCARAATYMRILSNKAWSRPRISMEFNGAVDVHACPHTTVSATRRGDALASAWSKRCYRCAPVLLHVCPHTATYVSSYCYRCVPILLYVCPHTTACLRILLYVSAYCQIRILLHICPAYYCICVRIYCMCPHTAM